MAPGRPRERVATVLLAHDHAEYVERALSSLLDHAGALLEAVLVDNGSGPEIARVFDAFEAKAGPAGHVTRRIRMETNVGAVAGRNAALVEVTADKVAFLDSDCMARTRGWLARLARALDERPEVGIVGPKLVYPWPPNAIQCAGCDVTTAGRVVFRGRTRPRDDPELCRERECPTLISACWLMRTRLFRELGGLDDRFSPVQFEDVDYCYRAREAGWKVLYRPRVEMYHFEGTTTRATPGIEYDRLTAQNAVKFKRRWRERILAEAGAPWTIEEKDAPPWEKDVGWRPLEEVLSLPGAMEVVDPDARPGGGDA